MDSQQSSPHQSTHSLDDYRSSLLPAHLRTTTLNPSDTSPRPLLMKDMSPLTPRSTSAPSPQPSPSSSSDAYIDVPSHFPHGLTEHDLSSLFNPSLHQELPKPDVLAQLIDRLASDKGPGDFDWGSPDRTGLGHCGCANETNSYIILLELSLRLRKASEVVGHHFRHFSGSTCGLNQRITELDKYISYVPFLRINLGLATDGCVDTYSRLAPHHLDSIPPTFPLNILITTRIIHRTPTRPHIQSRIW